MALGLLVSGTLLPDMVDRVCGKGDIDTAAIRRYSGSSGQPGEGVGWHATEQVWSLTIKALGKIIEYSFWKDRGLRECTSQGVWEDNACRIERCSGVWRSSCGNSQQSLSAHPHGREIDAPFTPATACASMYTTFYACMPRLGQNIQTNGRH